jgi:hypothetical protein
MEPTTLSSLKRGRNNLHAVRINPLNRELEHVFLQVLYAEHRQNVLKRTCMRAIEEPVLHIWVLDGLVLAEKDASKVALSAFQHKERDAYIGPIEDQAKLGGREVLVVDLWQMCLRVCL